MSKVTVALFSHSQSSRALQATPPIIPSIPHHQGMPSIPPPGPGQRPQRDEMGSLESPSGTHRARDSKGILSKPDTTRSSHLGRFPGSDTSRAPPLPHVSQRLPEEDFQPCGRWPQFQGIGAGRRGRWKQLPVLGKAEKRGVGRGLKGRRAVVRSRALAFPTERVEKPNSRLDLSSGSHERPRFVYPPPFDSKSP